MNFPRKNEHKTSTPIRGSCKRFQTCIDSSPIPNSKVIRTDCGFDNDIRDINFDDEMSIGIFGYQKGKNEAQNEKFVPNKPPISLELKQNSASQDLLSIDDSVLRCFDLDSATSSGKNNFNCNDSLIDSCRSPNCSVILTDINEDDHAWDMSICAVVKHENCDKQKCCYSQEPSEINNAAVDSMKWEDESLINSVEVGAFQSGDLLNNISDEKLDLSFGRKIKNILLNNAQKPAVKISQISNNNTQESDCFMNSSFFGLPVLVKVLIKKYKGITRLYDWQDECLNLEAVKARKNLVYALPTSGGKTLVAEILILNEILCREKNVIFVMPYVSIVQEKVRALSPFAVELGFLIEEYAGAKGSYPPQKRKRKRTVFIATIEKALGLVHSHIETGRISELGLMVIDELHLIGESRRGATLESMLTKLMFCSGGENIQLVGMSATIGNISEVGKFLKADIYTHDFRPVELNEFIKVDDEIFCVKSNEDPPLVFHSRTSFPYSPELKKQDPDEIGGLVREVSPHESCLVFCPSKRNCENVAVLICQILERDLLKYKVEEKQALFKALVSEGNGTVCSVLSRTLPYGVAYHNSGLTTAERKLLEEAFCAKTIFCICCTSTLAAGVNLPAKRVILRSPYVGRDFINLSRYKQMVGRAGRAGLSGGAGESFLICKPADTKKVNELLRSPMDFCKSQLFEKESISSFFLSAIGLSIATSFQSLKEMLEGTLLFIQNTNDLFNSDTLVKDTVTQLIESGAVKEHQQVLMLSDFGKAAMKGCFDIDTARILFKDLQSGRKCLVLLNHLHLLYLITPYSMLEQIKFDQKIFISKFLKLNSCESHVPTILGIDERCVSLMMSGRKIKGELVGTVHRLYLTFILYDLWNECSVWSVSEFYQLTRGLVLTLLNSAVSFASCVSRFCEELEELWCFRRLLVEITGRLSHCCKPELIPLMELPSVKIGRARQLYNAGFKTVNLIANAEPQSLVKAIDHLPRKVAHQIVAAAKLKLLTTAETLQEEAEEVLALLENKKSSS